MIYARRYLINGKLRPLARPFYQFTVAAELKLLALRERGLRFPDSPLLHEVTAVIKTFERPQALRRLVDSIRRLYPTLNIIVVDDSRESAHIAGVQTIRLPYNSGVSAGRQAGLDAVQTEFMLMLDDDFVFYRKTQLIPAVAAMQRYHEIDIMGGRVVNLPLFNSADYSRAALFPTQRASLLPPGSYVGDYPVYDKVANFFVGRTQRLQQVGWNPAIKRVEHADFFTRAKGKLVSVYNDDLRIIHAQTLFDQHYIARRNDARPDLALLRKRYYDS